MPRYFSKFPKLLMTKDFNTTLVTNLLARVNTIRGNIDNNSIFYEYDIQEGDTPEIIASKYYDDIELHWVVLLFNDRFDALYDWPLSYQNFLRYMNDKYGNIRYSNDTTLTGTLLFTANSNIVTGVGTSFEQEVTPGSQLFYIKNNTENVSSFIVTIDSINSDTELVLTSNSIYTIDTSVTNDTVMSGIHHFEKVIETTDGFTGETTTNIYLIDVDSYSKMQAEPLIQTSTFQNGETVTVKTYRRIVSNFDYESDANESKRRIKLVKRELIFDIKKQFDFLMEQ
jgi:hypothetical protein